MKKLIVSCILFTLLLSLILTACNSNINENPTDSSCEESVETTSDDVTSQVSEESSEYSNEGSDTSQESSLTQEESSEPEESYDEFTSKALSDLYHVGGRLFEDVCVCGTETYHFVTNRYYEDNLICYDGFVDIVVGSSAAQQYYAEITAKSHEENNYLPALYLFIKEFDISKEEYLAVIDQFKDGSYHDKRFQLTDKQIELLFGDYDPETIKKELKNDSTYYFEGKLYDICDIARLIDNELFQRMLEDDYFRLYMIQIENFLYDYAPNYSFLYEPEERVYQAFEKVKAEIENE